MFIPRVAKSLKAVVLKFSWSAWQLATWNSPAAAPLAGNATRLAAQAAANATPRWDRKAAGGLGIVFLLCGWSITVRRTPPDRRPARVRAFSAS
jgi:hypothetical protein